MGSGVTHHYDFFTDSTYREWSNVRPDSNLIHRTRDLDSGYFHLIDKNHFWILIINYGTRKVIYCRENLIPTKLVT
jgi:hypothetical protein